MPLMLTVGELRERLAEFPDYWATDVPTDALVTTTGKDGTIVRVTNGQSTLATIVEGDL